MSNGTRVKRIESEGAVRVPATAEEMQAKTSRANAQAADKGRMTKTADEKTAEAAV